MKVARLSPLLFICCYKLMPDDAIIIVCTWSLCWSNEESMHCVYFKVTMKSKFDCYAVFIINTKIPPLQPICHMRLQQLANSNWHICMHTLIYAGKYQKSVY